MSRASVLRKYNSIEVKCAKFGAFGCALSNFVNMLAQYHVIKIKHIPEEKRVVLTPVKYNAANLRTKSLFYIVSDICNDCPKYNKENVKQRVQEEPQPNIQVFPYTTPCEEQKIQEVEKLPKIYCKLQQNKKQNER